MSELNLPPFYVGQKVVAIKSTPYIKKGVKYTILSMYYSGCCKKWSAYVGLKDNLAIPLCIKHDVTHELPVKNGVYHNSKYFAPVQENFQSISLEKVLEKETPLISVN